MHHWVIIHELSLNLTHSWSPGQYLATADGVIFKSFGELVCTTAAFRMKGQVGVCARTRPISVVSNRETPSANLADADRSSCIYCFASEAAQVEANDTWPLHLVRRAGDVRRRVPPDRRHAVSRMECVPRATTGSR